MLEHFGFRFGWQLQAASDLLIGLACTSIAVALVLLVRKRRDFAVLRADEAAWQGTFESAPIGIAHTTLDGRWLRLNDTLCRITGYSREELQGTNFLAITHPEDLEKGAAMTAQLAAGEIPAFAIEKRYLRKDGATTWINLTVSLHRTRPPHEEPYFIAMVQDITTRKTAEEGRREAEALFRTLAEGIPSMAWVRRNDGSYEYLNPQWHAYTGLSEADLAKHGHEQLIHPEELPTVKKRYQAAVAAGKEYVTEFRHRRHDGEWRWTDSRVAPVRDAQGKILRWVGMLTDVHDQRQEREHLLQKERAARNEAEEASRLKDEFLAIVSHELRTPLSAIFGWSQLLLSPEIAATELRKGLETISRNARLQAQIIDDLLDMSRIITGKIRLDLQTVDLPEILEKALDSVRPAAVTKGVRIETMIHPSCPVKGDPDRLQQILWNLFSNAIRFTPGGGTMQVTLERVGSHLEVTVSDTGEGIDPEFLPFVFDRFRQQDSSTSRAHGGLGLGLSIVRNLVELHGGEIRGLSAGLGKGSTFILRLPILADLAQALESRESEDAAFAFGEPGDPSLEGLKVLVVDDEPDTREILQRILESCDAQVLVAASAREALTLLLQEKPNVLVSDIGMPHEDGYWLIQQVRSLAPEEGGSIPALALTALARSEDRIRALRAGFQAHTAKPVETAELTYLVAGLAGRRGGSRQTSGAPRHRV